MGFDHTEESLNAPGQRIGQRVPLRDISNSIMPHILLTIFQIVALAGPQYSGRRFVTCSVIVVLAAQCHLGSFTNDLALANFVSLAWPHYLLTLSFFMFGSPDGPETDLWRIDRQSQEATALRAFSPRKIKWAMAMLLALRGVRWNWEVPHIPRRVQLGERESLLRFTLLQVVDLAWATTMMALFTQLGARLFFIDPLTGSTYADTKNLTIRRGGPLVSLGLAFIYGATPYFCINSGYILLSIISVLLGVCAPEDWPPLFGKIASAWTVRRFWNRFWHQFIRKGLTSFSTGFAKFLGLKKGTTAYSYVHLYTAFLISGAFHAGSILILPAPANITLQDRTVGMVSFFLWQSVAITLEDFFQWGLCAGFGAPGGAENWAVRLFGYAWVICSFWFSLPLAAAVQHRVRLAEDAPIPLFQSLAQRIPIP